METAKRLIRKADKLLNLLVGLFMALVFLYGGYALWDTYIVYNKTTLPDEVMHYKPSKETPTLAELQKLNPDVCAWLTIDDTNIDYPIVRGSNNMEYLNKDFYGGYSLGGSIFLDSANSPDFTDFYSLIYGHHMEGGAMFGDVTHFEDKTFFDSHATGWLMLPNRTYKLEIYACMNVDAYDSHMFTPVVSGDAERRELLSYIGEKALRLRQIDVGTSDRIIAISTCSSATTNGRTMVVAKLVEYTRVGSEF